MAQGASLIYKEVRFMNKKRVRLIYFAALLIFSLEMILATKFTEPYPAILYPPFADIPLENSTVLKPTMLVFLSTGDSVEVLKKEIFYGLSNVKTNVILSENFTSEKSFIALKNNKRKLEATIGVKKAILSLESVSDSGEIKDGIAWTKQRLAETVGRDDIERLEVHWFSYKLSSNQEDPLLRDKLVEKFILTFN